MNVVDVEFPALFDVCDKIGKNVVSRLHWAKGYCEQLEWSVYNKYGVDGLELVRDGESKNVLVVERNVQTKFFDYILKVDELSSVVDLTEGRWLFPKPKPQAPSDVTPPEVLQSWSNRFHIIEESLEDDEPVFGLRSPQIGALYATLAHWRVSDSEATIVLPTGTGKTDAMLAIYAHQRIQKLLVIVPTDALRTQIGEKFLTLGVLKKFGLLEPDALHPFVGLLKSGIKSVNPAIEFINKCNVIVATMSAIQACDSSARNALAEYCTHMFVDEAHHLSARTWDDFRQLFKSREGVILQFTATPFREDGKKLPGKIIFHYPLRYAQDDGYFTKVNFRPLLEFNESEHDSAIALAAVEQLKSDLDPTTTDKSGKTGAFDHVILARCGSIKRAEAVLEIYQEIAASYNPIMIHSQLSQADYESAKRSLFDGDSRIVVCVDMFGEGFDYPQLKIGALHDVHKSLGITLQFTGRFARTRDGLGDATIIANLAQAKVVDALDRLYAEDADWNHILGFIADDATREERDVQDFMNGFSNREETPVSIRNLTPSLSALIYEADLNEFRPQNIGFAFKEEEIVGQVYSNHDENIAFVIIKNQASVSWGHVGYLMDVNYDLYVAYWHEDHKLLFVYGSNRNGNQKSIAQKLLRTQEPRLISGDDAFRVFGDVKPLMLMNLGLKDAVNRRVRFTMLVGSDIRSGIDSLMQQNRVMTNVFGRGYRNGKKVDFGSSRKGRVWSYQSARSLLAWKRWCGKVGDKIRDNRYTKERILEHALVPKEVLAVPGESRPVCVSWDDTIWLFDQCRIWFVFASSPKVEISLLEVELRLVKLCDERKTFVIELVGDSAGQKYISRVNCRIVDSGMSYEVVEGPEVDVKRSSKTTSLADFFDSCPPQFRFVDGSILVENTWCEIKFAREDAFDASMIEVWDWDGVDITKESMWKDNQERADSIQARVLSEIAGEGHAELVFNDDGSGEAADVISFSVNDVERVLYVRFYHLKYTSTRAGRRVSDLYEVCGQAQNSVHWKFNIESLLEHMQARAVKALGRKFNRFYLGGEAELNKIKYFLNRLDLDFRIYIVQPGVKKSEITATQKELLAATRSFLHQSLSVPLKVIASE